MLTGVKVSARSFLEYVVNLYFIKLRKKRRPAVNSRPSALSVKTQYGCSQIESRLMPPPCYVWISYHLSGFSFFLGDRSFWFRRFRSGWCSCRFFRSSAFQSKLYWLLIPRITVRSLRDLSFFRFFISFSHESLIFWNGKYNKGLFLNKLINKNLIAPS